MKTILFAVLALSRLHAWAVDWLRYHNDPQQALEIFLDLDSLRQTNDGFETDIRLSVGQGQQEFRAKQAVNCQANTFRLWNSRKLRSNQGRDEEGPDEAGPIVANTALSGLKALYCAHWKEPAGVRWKGFAATPGETHFYDERIEQTRGKPGAVLDGVQNEFIVHLKTQGVKNSVLAQVQFACRENTFAIQTGTLRDETRGWLANMPPTLPAAPKKDSAAAILLSMFCTPSSRGQSVGQ